MGAISRRAILLSCRRLRPIGVVQLELRAPPGNRLANGSYKKKHLAVSDTKAMRIGSLACRPGTASCRLIRRASVSGRWRTPDTASVIRPRRFTRIDPTATLAIRAAVTATTICHPPSKHAKCSYLVGRAPCVECAMFTVPQMKVSASRSRRRPHPRERSGISFC